MPALRRPSLLTAVLVYVTAISALISSLGAPLLPTIASDLDVSVSTAQWSLTVTLLTAAVASPVMGRLGDGPHRRETFIVGLSAVLAGNVLAALASSFEVLVAGRALQGLGLSLVPLAMAEARYGLPQERVSRIIALLSVSAAAGIGIGYPVSAVIADHLGLSAGFWFGAVVSGLALLSVLVVVGPSVDRPPLRIDLGGTALFTVGLVALLLAIAEGNRWGWTAAATLALFAGAAVTLAVCAAHQLRSRAPVVQLRLLRIPAVLTSNVCAIVIGVAIYVNLTVVTEYVQVPAEVGYGFSESVTFAGLCLIPFALLSVPTSRVVPWLTRTVGQRAVLPIGSLVVAGATAFFAVAHTSLWQAFAAMGLVGIGMGTTFAAIPGFIERAVPSGEFGSAMGFYQVVRYVGFSLGSALTAAILDAHTNAGETHPEERGYLLALWVAAGACALVAALAWVLPQDRVRRG